MGQHHHICAMKNSLLFVAILFVCAACGRSCPGAAIGDGARVGAPFTLTAHTGEVVSDRDFHGQHVLIYFGFTYCPDVCPLALQQMDLALNQLNDRERAAYQPIFISVDPERDTPDVLASYVASNGFPENLVGLTGSVEDIGNLAQSYSVYFSKVELENSRAEYTVDHSSIIFLMDHNGEFIDLFTHTTPPEAMATVLKHQLACAA